MLSLLITIDQSVKKQNKLKKIIFISLILILLKAFFFFKRKPMAVYRQYTLYCVYNIKQKMYARML